MSGLVLRDVTVVRGGRPVLAGLNLAFAAGRLTVVIGPNGAGKSTLLEVAAGLRPPHSGTVTLGGEPLARLGRRALARRRSYLPQNPRVEWPISVERVVALGLSPHLPAFGALPAPWRGRIEAALGRHELTALRDRPATDLSGGELARTMLARATVGTPELLLADEPTAGLDPRHALDAADRLRRLADEGCTIVVALHDLDLAARIADDVVALRDGRMLAAGAAQGLLTGELLGGLYDVPVRVIRDAGGVAIRFGPSPGWTRPGGGGSEPA